MRATVAGAQSHAPIVEPVMSRLDYEQNALHHSCLLVLLRGVGPSRARILQRAFEKVRRVNNIKVTDSSGVVRTIYFRFIHEHPVEHNDWGDFQTHRRLLGLITIGKFENQTELNELCRHHESLKVRYGGTLYESRAIFFGPDAAANESLAIQNKAGITTVDNAQADGSTDLGVLKETQHPLAATRLQDEFTTPSNFKSQAFFYREQDNCIDLETRVSDFLNALFWVLESRRLERSRERAEKVSLLLAPFEKRDFVGLDMESRNNRKRCVGRVMKNLADLSLQAGLLDDALSLYHNANETLRSVGDSLWVGASEEGLCAASAVILYPQMREIETLHRNASLQETGTSPLRNTPEKWRASDATKKINTPANCADAITSNSSSCSSVSSLLTNNSSASGTPTTSSSSSTSTISATPFGHQRNGELPGNILKPEEITNYYRKAIINYSKYRHAATIETEAALKATRICIEQNRPLDVAMFLQNILYINLSLSEAERVKRFEIMTELYQQIGYQRKAAFFQRLAALKHVQQGSQAPDWTQSYRLMLGSFTGYLLSLDPLEVLENAAGWPALQIDLAQNLITAARRLGQSALATRHMTFLLQTQWDNMTATEQSEMAVQLQNLSAQCEGSPVPLVLDNGTVIPPANLTDLPYCMEMVVKDLPTHLRPQRIKIAKADSGPFLFTPIHFNSVDRRDKKKDKNKIAFLWVQNDLSEVCVRLRNPLPFELAVTDMRLLSNGVVFESLPQTVILQPHVPTNVALHGTPIETGQLDLQGYSTHTLGVKSNCRLKHMRGRHLPPNYLVDVIPALPRISVKTSLPQTATFSNMNKADIVVTSASLTLYNGESSSCTITIKNESNTLPLEHLEVNINSNVEQEMQKKMFRIDEQALQAQLPVAPQGTLEFVVDIYAEADFVCPMPPGSLNTSADYGPSSMPHYASISTSGHASLPVGISSPQHRRQDLQHVTARSTIAAAQHSLAALNLQPGGADGSSSLRPQQLAQHIEAQLRLKYSGGEALTAGYCRQCAVSLNLELIPSAQITSWDVLPAEIPSQFYLVLDISNLTAQEMSLNYTENKNILIEAKESCRVPIPVDRCSLEQVCAARAAEVAENLERELCFRTQLLSFSDALSKLCSTHIAERVKINWLLTGTDIQGVASLRGIVLSHGMVDLTTVSPLEWSISFQDTLVQPHSEIVATVGQRAQLSINLTNQSLQPLKNLVLTIKFYQDYLNGMENYNLETRVAISGPNRITIPVLEKHAQTQHNCSVIFFTPGRFKTSIECVTKPQTQQKNSIPGSGSGATNTTSQLETMSTSSFDEQQAHTWKFIPPIEVTVVEQ
ncbi:protein brunelleschi [Drosophila sulfurigaster albostrigata]|uniref:protein brunelleschi n=1 Tax=Drosophila sulfurigaster albostrigata TaxID=89887 RepID=UPI002D21ED4A|nr:protein brunelleschi [Drosophila sulfurigaster albostrigata]